MREFDFFMSMFNKSFFNPFKGIKESDAHPHAHTLRTPLKSKFNDLYGIIFGTIHIAELIPAAIAYYNTENTGDENSIHAAKQKLFQIIQQSHLGLVDLVVLVPFVILFIIFMETFLAAAMLPRAVKLVYQKNKLLGLLLGIIVYPALVVGVLAWTTSAATVIATYLLIKFTIASIITAAFAAVPLIVHAIAQFVGRKERAAFKTLPIESFNDVNNLTLSTAQRTAHNQSNVHKLLSDPALYDHCELKMPDAKGATQLEQEGYLAIYQQKTPYNQNPDLVVRFNELLQNKPGTIALFKFNFFNIAREDEDPISHRMKKKSEQLLRFGHADLYNPLIRRMNQLDRPVHRPQYISDIFKQHGIDHRATSSTSLSPITPTHG